MKDFVNGGENGNTSDIQWGGLKDESKKRV